MNVLTGGAAHAYDLAGSTLVLTGVVTAGLDMAM